MKYSILATVAIATFTLGAHADHKGGRYKDYTPEHGNFESGYDSKLRNGEGNIVHQPLAPTKGTVVHVDNEGRGLFYPALTDAFYDDSSRGPQEPVHHNEPGVDVE